eukprot:CAMPEP_0179368780 /NCGR_PEP_ID=MMETSP0797-20121207/84281_1 /TAXON_ID=47934 /ORGANISM="Dinophysis acuminata, Strain DAEP01" /LENGTH=32 /DNA_ID= /DNA_START= /DNA_END= /DNA_ORIENTATION=
MPGSQGSAPARGGCWALSTPTLSNAAEAGGRT